MTSQIIWASIFSRIVFKEHIGSLKIIAAILCIGGTMMILRPDFLTTGMEKHLYHLVAIAAGVLGAIEMITKQMSVLRTLKTSNWVLWNCTFTLIIVLVAIFATKPILLELATIDTLFILLFAFAAVMMRVLYVYSLNFTTAPVAITAFSSSLVFMLCFQYTVLKVSRTSHLSVQLFGLFHFRSRGVEWKISPTTLPCFYFFRGPPPATFYYSPLQIHIFGPMANRHEPRICFMYINGNKYTPNTILNG